MEVKPDMTLNEKVNAIRNRAEELLQKYQIKGVNIRFDLRGTVAGQAGWKRAKTWSSAFSGSKMDVYDFKLRFNTHYLNDNFEDMLNNTVPHEVAHLIDAIRHGKSGHGFLWKSIMRELGCKPERCHDYDMSHVYSHTVKCACKEHKVSRNIYQKIASGQRRRCRNCKTVVYIPSITGLYSPADNIQIVAHRPSETTSLGPEKVSYKQLCANLIKEGKSKERIKEEIVERYLSEGKELSWAKTRANAIYAHMSKEVK